MSASQNIHATGLLLDGIGLILRGPSGAGKSLLALDLIEQWQARGRPAALVSDDRVVIVTTGGELSMQAAPNIAGLIELRGRGIVRRPFVETAPLHLVIDLVETLERMLEEDALVTELCGIAVARAPVPRAGVVDSRHQLLLIGEAIAAVNAAAPPARQKTT